MTSKSDKPFQIQCFTCGNWFSSDQVDVSLEGMMPYLTNYEYTCKSCNTETLIKKPASFIQVSITAIANLMAQSANEDKEMKTHFDLDEDIYPFVWDHWDIICTKRSKSGNWRNNLSTKLTTETIIFTEKDGKFGLVDQDLSTIGPKRYESKTIPQKSVGKLKRKADTNQTQSASKKAKSDIVIPNKGLSHGYPLEYPYNKDGYRYVLAEKDPHSSIMLDSEDMAGRPIPPEVYRPWIASTVLLTLHDRAPQIKVSENRLTAAGDKGYCMIRATHGVSQGTWYYEVHIDDMTAEGGALRLGWSQSLANLQAPCGYDKLSYSWRSKKGTKFHQSRGKHYSEGYGEGDTLGFLIHLPTTGKKTSHPSTYKDKALIKFKNHFYFEEKDEPVEEFEKSLKILKGSKMFFYKNGICQGEAFSDVYRGTYYPTVSFYKSTVISTNFGPDFKYPPTDKEFKTMSDAADLVSIKQTMSEMLFHVESKLSSRTTAQYPANYKFN